MRATYSPEDNKLRLYPSSRLAPEDYEKFKTMGFKWAPKQELFVAPMWTPGREDLLIEFCGEIGDEDTTLAERAEQRAERFEDYSGKRASEAHRAREGVAAISGGIPLGQPILVGHHSQRRAEKDAERIENGMKKAVNLWATSKYWQSRAAGAMAAAKYKEKPGVRARRIKNLGAELRSYQRDKARAEKYLNAFTVPNLSIQQAIIIAGSGECRLTLAKKEGDKPDWSYKPSAYDALTNGSPSLYAPRTLEEVIEAAKIAYPRSIAKAQRWIEHYENRIAYETALLEEQGEGQLLEKKPRPAQKPILNYPGKVVIKGRYRNPDYETELTPITKSEWAAIHADYKGTVDSADGTHRVRQCIIKSHLTAVYLSDSKIHDKPEPVTVWIDEAEKITPEFIEAINKITPAKAAVWLTPLPLKNPEPDPFAAMEQQLKTGIKVVSAPQLFPTPDRVAAGMVDALEIEPGEMVLEPSAGTGAIIRAIKAAQPEAHITAVEINYNLAEVMRDYVDVMEHEDFLQYKPDGFKFDKVIMNPPFANGSDIKHVKHAMTMLKPGGMLCAIMADGPRQKKFVQEIGLKYDISYTKLEDGTFKEQGTDVRTFRLVIKT